MLFQLLYSSSVTEETAYRAQFVHVADRAARGESSVRYLYYPEVVTRLRNAVPAAKIIIILRNPVDRLWSHYVMMRARYHLESASLTRALALEPARMAAGWDYDWHYVAVGRYAAQVRRYIESFGNKNVLVYFYDDFVRAPLETVRGICRFLGVSDDFTPDMSRCWKVGYGLRVAWLDKLLFYPHWFQPLFHRVLDDYWRNEIERRAIAWNRVRIPRLPTAARCMLRARFADEFPQLETLLGRSLPASW
jgi:hypothetical protein